MKKKLEMTIIKCFDCPFCYYNGEYGPGYVSGFDCKHDEAYDDNRIINDEDMNKQQGKCRKKHTKIIIKVKIPDWCPLPTM